MEDGVMFRFLIGVAFGAAGYWAWQSFGRDLLGMGSDQETTYGGFNAAGTSNNGGATASDAYGSGSTSATGSGSTGAA